MYIIFICFTLYILYKVADIIKHKGFKDLNIYRKIDKNRVFKDEEFKITTILENKKRLPISFVYVKEKFYSTFQFVQNNLEDENEGFKFNVSKYSLRGYERRVKTIRLKASKRGIYTISDVNITIGDIFGYTVEEKEIKSYIEIIVYPEVKNISEYKFSSTSLYGDNIIKRWIYKDPLFIRGIREYAIGDRLKDVHWSSSAKMNKLMVKEYDYTSERELIIMINVEYGKGIWSSEHEVEVENAISIAASLAAQSIKLGIDTGMWTNSRIVSPSSGEFSTEIRPSVNSLKSILELCARMYNMQNESFIELLKRNTKKFNNNCTYVIIASFLSEEVKKFIYDLSLKGIDIILIDVSSNLKLSKIRGIEKVDFKGGGII